MQLMQSHNAAAPTLWRLEFKVPVRFISEFVHLFENWAESIWWESPKDPEEAVAAGISTEGPLSIQANFLVEENQSQKVYQEIIGRLSITALLKGVKVSPVSFEPIPEVNWLVLNYQDFPPLTVGRFFIHGAHIKSLEDPKKISLQIDASTAFGSGKHVTTQGCLLLLDELAKTSTFKRPLDMGCGSGILAISIAATWKVKVTAVDIDPEAIRVTLRNAAINNLEDKITGIVSNGFINAEILEHSPFDLITANILAVPLCEMANVASRILQPKAKVILSGILNHQAQKVIEAYKKEGINLLKLQEYNEWTTLFLEKS